jgi:hypothetical protein
MFSSEAWRLKTAWAATSFSGEAAADLVLSMQYAKDRVNCRVGKIDVNSKD